MSRTNRASYEASTDLDRRDQELGSQVGDRTWIWNCEAETEAQAALVAHWPERRGGTDIVICRVSGGGAVAAVRSAADYCGGVRVPDGLLPGADSIHAFRTRDDHPRGFDDEDQAGITLDHNRADIQRSDSPSDMDT